MPSSPAKTIRVPSGVQVGALARTATVYGDPPFRETTLMIDPWYALVKASRRPSGDQAGCVLKTDVPLLRFRMIRPRGGGEEDLIDRPVSESLPLALGHLAGIREVSAAW
jgi:hypothetical protein